MAKPTDLTDPFFQTALVEAEQALDVGDYLRTVRQCVEVYSRIAAQRPDMILKPPSQLMPLPQARAVREGRRNALLPWPVRLGVGISFDESGKPHLTFREFSMSEAAPIFEYTLDVAMRARVLLRTANPRASLAGFPLFDMISGRDRIHISARLYRPGGHVYHTCSA